MAKKAVKNRDLLDDAFTKTVVDFPEEIAIDDNDAVCLKSLNRHLFPVSVTTTGDMC